MIIVDLSKFSNLIAQEESYWRQRSKVFWLKEGDLNSSFSIHIPSQGKKQTLLALLTRDDWTIDHGAMCYVFYCNLLFQ